MEIQAFLALDVPFMVVVYLAVLLFLHVPRAVIFASLLGGLVMGLINMLIDLAAYYAHWWHYYTLNGLILHVPLPFYITPVLVYGSITYLLIWRFISGRNRWLALLLLIGVPIVGMLRDVVGAIAGTSYVMWESGFAAPMVALMWIVMFGAGYLVFKRLAPVREDETVKKEQSKTNIIA